MYDVYARFIGMYVCMYIRSTQDILHSLYAFTAAISKFHLYLYVTSVQYLPFTSLELSASLRAGTSDIQAHVYDKTFWQQNACTTLWFTWCFQWTAAVCTLWFTLWCFQRCFSESLLFAHVYICPYVVENVGILSNCQSSVMAVLDTFSREGSGETVTYWIFS